MTAVTNETNVKTRVHFQARSRNYLLFLVVLMGLVAILDQYISMIKMTAIPYITKEYGITAAQFSWYEALYLIPTFLIFLLNGLNDVIGRKYSILVLVLLMGLSTLGIVLFTPSIHLFMAFYALAMFTTVSNMWSIPVSEESPAEKRAKYVSIVYVIGLLPLQAILPSLLMDVLGLGWKWLYGVSFIIMLPVVAMWAFMKETKRYSTVEVERRNGTRKHHIMGLGVINRNDLRYIIIASAIWLTWLIYQFLFTMAGHYFMDIKGYPRAQWDLVLLFTLLAAMAGGILGGRIMDRLGRKPAFVAGCLALSAALIGMAFTDGIWLTIATVVTGFFTSFTYTWIVVYVPEIFPTERRGACMGWTSTITRGSYVLGPMLTAVLLDAFPGMTWFWLAAAAVVFIPLAIMLFVKLYETKTQELEVIEEMR